MRGASDGAVHVPQLRHGLRKGFTPMTSMFRRHSGLSPDSGFAWRMGKPVRFCPSTCFSNNRLSKRLPNRLTTISKPGALNPQTLGPRMRTVYIRSDRVSDSTAKDNEAYAGIETRGQFTPCAVCGKAARSGRSYVQDHQTKGDQPFQALVARQIQIQPRILRKKSTASRHYKDARSWPFPIRGRLPPDSLRTCRCIRFAILSAHSLRGATADFRVCLLSVRS